MLTGSKNAAQSTTIVSLVASLVFLLLGQLGLELAETDKAQAIEATSLVFSAGAQLVAIWGRWRATKRIASSPG